MVMASVLSTGCFSEQAFPMKAADIRRVRPISDTINRPTNTREWLVHAQRDLAPLLPTDEARPLLSGDLVTADRKPVDVFKHFNIDPTRIESVFANYYGLMYTAQLVSRGLNVEKPPKTWPGFEDLWIPVSDNLSLSGRMGYSRDANGAVREAPCIVLLPGFFGDIGVQRTRDLAGALISNGYHVLAVEMRGHGQTGVRYPDVYYTFGVFECGDLIKVSEWLEAKPHITTTGLIGFCYGGHTALLTAWFDGRCDYDPTISPLIKPHLQPHGDRRHFAAGVLAFSPTVRFEEVIDWLDEPQDGMKHPVLAGLQDTIRLRMEQKNHPNPSGSLRRLIAHEFSHTVLSDELALKHAYNFLRMMPYQDKTAYDKMDAAAVPVLIVSAADDPMIPSQWTADFMAWTRNPNVAAVVLPSGGHTGFPAWARSYYFSLIVNFFDPNLGPGPALKPYFRRTSKSFDAARNAKGPPPCGFQNVKITVTADGIPPVTK